MMVLFMVLLHCSLSSSAQVTIKKETAEYFLEADDERWKLREKDSVQQVVIEKLKQEVYEIRTALTTYKVQEILDAGIYNEMFDEITQRDEYIEYIEQRLRKKNRLIKVLAGTSAGTVIGSAVGQPIVGGVVGGAAGFFIDLFKKKNVIQSTQ
jgi:valyl-tRNA synthetase